MIRAVLLDLDGTLVDSRIDLANAVNFALKRTGQPEQDAGDIVEHIGNGMRVLLSAVMGPVPDETLNAGIEEFKTYYAEHCLDNTRMYEGVLETLSALPGSTRFAVVTNKPLAFTEKILSGLGIRERFGAVLGGDSLAERKPHPAPVLKALEELAIEEGFALMVGDGAQDVRSGQAAGVLTCVAKYGFGFRPGLLELRPDYSINSFRELKEIVS